MITTKKPAQQQVATGPLRVTVISDYQEFLELADQWDQLLDASSSNCVFLTHRWLRCWWEVYRGANKLFILCARRDGRLVGVAPLRIEESTFRHLPVRRLAFMVNGSAPDADFIAVSPRGQAIRAMFAYLARHSDLWDILDLERLSDDSYIWRCITELSAGAGLSLHTRADKQVPYIPIEGDWESFIAQRSRGFRKQMNKRRNRIAKHHEEVRVVRLKEPQEVLSALEQMFEISSRSWKAQRGSAITNSEAQMKFYRTLSAEFAPAGCVDLWLLYCGDAAIAFEYHLRHGGVTSPLRADFDEAFAELSPGAYLEQEVLRNLFENTDMEVTECNTCADGYAYERRWTDLIRAHHRAWIFHSGFYGLTLRVLASLRRRHRNHETQSVREIR